MNGTESPGGKVPNDTHYFPERRERKCFSSRSFRIFFIFFPLVIRIISKIILGHKKKAVLIIFSLIIYVGKTKKITEHTSLLEFICKSRAMQPLNR